MGSVLSRAWNFFRSTWWSLRRKRSRQDRGRPKEGCLQDENREQKGRGTK